MASLTGKLPNMRDQFIAAPGWKLIGADWAQQELRVMWPIARDEVLGAALQSGDVYTEDAKAIFGLHPGTHKKVEKCEKGQCPDPEHHVKSSARHTAKTGHLAFQFGVGLAKFHTQMIEADQSVTFETSRLVWEALRKRYFRTVEYWFEEQEKVLRTHYSETRILHRRRLYPRPPDLSEVANFPVQGTARDIASICLVQVSKLIKQKYKRRTGKGYWAYFIKDFHDAFMLEAKDEVAEEVCSRVVSIMQQPFEIEGRVCTFPVEAKIGARESDV